MLITIRKLKGHSLSLSIKEALTAFSLPIIPQRHFISLEKCARVVRLPYSVMLVRTLYSSKIKVFRFEDSPTVYYVHPKTFVSLTKKHFKHILRAQAKKVRARAVLFPTSIEELEERR
jgi:hypothetical protein